MAKQKMTLDKLGGMVKKGFDEVNCRIDKVDKKIDNVKVELKGEIKDVKKEIGDLQRTDGRIERKLDVVVRNQDGQENRIKVLEKQAL